jgi:hypothetical protein
MASTADVTKFFEAVSVLAYGLTAAKLFTSGIYRRYRVFFGYLLFAVPWMASMAWMDPASPRYMWVFVYTEPVEILFSILIVFELYRLVLADYKGLYTLGKWAMIVAVAISAVFSIVSVLPVLSHASRRLPSWRVAMEMKVEAPLDLGLVLSIFLILLFLSRYPVRLRRNVLIYFGVYSVFFLANSIGLLLFVFQGIQIRDGVNVVLIGISAACAITWWLGLNRQGEEVQMHAPVLQPASEERLLLQLDALNAALAKISRN